MDCFVAPLLAMTEKTTDFIFCIFKRLQMIEERILPLAWSVRPL